MKITRRDLFKRLGGGVALAVAGVVAAKAYSYRRLGTYFYRKSAVGETMLHAAHMKVDPPLLTVRPPVRGDMHPVEMIDGGIKWFSRIGKPHMAYDFKFSTVQAYEMPATYWQTRWGWPVR